ncbi:cutinase family protein [Corynebacterium renale]|uniref:Cutinase n=1 Tax=Corynebacterium renale TaxID=1724 RepID=A0A2A9DPI5_9CORY|nr:cutinase family protein [Corynebacterium renale]PFG27829.1 Cutinase [Corynebacterium renale]SQI22048.1 putative secreted protein [Corynebacterium renale]STD00178.1 putative secreted protein [Corynebacterium renale]
MRKFLTILAVVIVVIAIGVGVSRWLSDDTPDTGSSSDDSGIAEPPEQPDWCPAVQVIAAPGTWESSADDDPLNPQANPYSFMLSITQPLQERYAGQNVTVWTLPYTAEFKNIDGGLGQMSYDDSRQEGVEKTNAELAYVHGQCPATKFILTGFSQGAVLLGDITSDIGNGRGVVPADAILGTALIADGRRLPTEGQLPEGHVELTGIGAEITLHPLNALIQPIVPGATMRGVRDGGFGSLDAATFQICAADDTICDAPENVSSAIERVRSMIDANGIHAQYATNPNVIAGTTANQWVVDWASGLIDGAVAR